MSPIRLALIGAGTFMQHAHLPALERLSDRFEVVAVYSRSESTISRLLEGTSLTPKAYFDLDEVINLPFVDAVDIALPINVMPDVVVQALAAGKHVFSEKPIAPEVALAEEMLSVASDFPDQIWMVGENWRYAPSVTESAALLREDYIGAVQMFNWPLHIPMSPENRYYQTEWRRQGDFPGGFILDTGVHHIATLRMLFGEVASVSAYTALNRSELPPIDTLAATLQFESGLIGTYTITFSAAAPLETVLTILGEQGYMRLNRSQMGVSRFNVETQQTEMVKRVRPDDPNGVLQELIGFADAIQYHQPHHNTPLQAAQDLAVVEAMLESAQSGSHVVPVRFVE